MQDEQGPESPSETTAPPETPAAQPELPAPEPPTHQERHTEAREKTAAEALAMVQAEDPDLATLMVSRYGGYQDVLCRKRNPGLWSRIRRP